MASEIISIELKGTNSRIVRENNDTIYCANYKGLKGLFLKDKGSITAPFGRMICDIIKQELDNQGFFTSDELPSYGITRSELRRIRDMADAQEDDLVAVFAYDEAMAQETKILLDKLLLLVFNYLSGIAPHRCLV